MRETYSFNCSRFNMALNGARSGAVGVFAMSAMLKREQLNDYVSRIQSGKYAVFYDMSSESYFKVERAYWASEITEAIDSLAASSNASPLDFQNGQGWLRLMNP